LAFHVPLSNTIGNAGWVPYDQSCSEELSLVVSKLRLIVFWTGKNVGPIGFHLLRANSFHGKIAVVVSAA